LSNCTRLQALDSYYSSLQVTHWKDLPKTKSNDIISETHNVDYNSTLCDDISSTSDYESTCDSDSDSMSDTFDMNGEIDKESSNKHSDYYKLLVFLDDHPQCETHKVQLLHNCNAKVPDFVGGVLPRCDKGNQEDYCMTMLTLFKPWRIGTDLKSRVNTWSSAFETHQFSDCQKEIMINFNLRYECNDARDDFASQRKSKRQTSNDWPFDLNDDVLTDVEDNFDGILLPDNIDFQDGDSWMNLAADDKSSRLQVERMMAAEDMLQCNGLVDSKFEDKNIIKSLPIIENATQSGNYWQNLLKKQKEHILQERIGQATSAQEKSQAYISNTVNKVKVIDQSYFEKSFKAYAPEDQALIQTTVTVHTLNNEQTRAFCIIANHATLVKPPQLKMYLGGMAGTGKSQVIKALMYFFKERNQSYRFMCMAPTGSAASLIGGSTYHSVLGINPYREKTDQLTSLNDVRYTLKYVDYIFMDEISMIDCTNLYNISKQMCKALDDEFNPFGGKNMIFTGDFAQLPPVSTGKALYSNTVTSVLHTTQSYAEQEAALSKAIWHQFTTAVILRENMRQRSQSVDDAKL
jgi:hypothetical protein